MRELAAAQRAYSKTDLLNQRRAAWQAHLIAGWSRAKRLPSWATVKRRFERYDPPKSPQQLLEIAKGINAALGGKTVKRE